MLELKEIQRSLPRANQLPDPISGKKPSHFLSAVPIGLLPLLPEMDSGSSRNSSSNSSPASSPAPSSPMLSPWRPPPTPQFRLSPLSQLRPNPHPHPAHLAHLLPGRPTPERIKPRFTFLPLLDTPPTSEPASPFSFNSPIRSLSPELPSDTDQSQDPPTPSLTNASLDSSPHSRPSSCSPEPTFLELPPLHTYSPQISGLNGSKYTDASYFPPFAEETAHDVLGMRSNSHSHHEVKHGIPSNLPPSPFVLGRKLAEQSASHKECTTPSPPRTPRKRNFIVVNGIEMDLDGDDDEADSPTPPASSPPRLNICNLPEQGNVLTPAMADLSISLGIPHSSDHTHPPVPREGHDLTASGPSHERDSPSLHTPSPPPQSSSPPPLALTPPSIPVPSSISSPRVRPTSPSPSLGSLHAPIRFKRVATANGRDQGSSFSHCGSMRQRSSPCSSPVFVPLA